MRQDFLFRASLHQERLASFVLLPSSERPDPPPVRLASSRLTTICGRFDVYTRCDKISCFGKAFIRNGLLLLCFCLRLSALTLRLASLAQAQVQLVQVWPIQLSSLPLEEHLLAAFKLFLGPLQLGVLMRMATASPS